MATTTKPKAKFSNHAAEQLRGQIEVLGIEADAYLKQAATMPDGGPQDALLAKVEKIQEDQTAFLAALKRMHASDAVSAEKAAERIQSDRSRITRLVPSRFGPVV